MSMTHVLFVDDDLALLQGLRRSLRRLSLPWQMEFVTSGKEALDCLGETSFDVIVSDLRMPGMSGQELLKQAAEIYPDMVQVILSGMETEEVNRGKLNSGTEFLAKPCSSDKLVATIQRGIFLKEFFRRGALNRLIESFEDLTAIPELQIRIRSVNKLGEGCTATVAEIICPDLGLRLRIPVRRGGQRVEPVLEGTI